MIKRFVSIILVIFLTAGNLFHIMAANISLADGASDTSGLCGSGPASENSGIKDEKTPVWLSDTGDLKFEKATSCESFFNDVKNTDWYADAVAFAVEEQLMAGTGGGRFCPELPVTRGMAVTVLYNMEKKLHEQEATKTDLHEQEAAKTDLHEPSSLGTERSNQLDSGTNLSDMIDPGADQHMQDGSRRSLQVPDAEDSNAVKYFGTTAELHSASIAAQDCASAVTQYSASTADGFTDAVGFTDLKDGAYYETPALWAASAGIAAGFPDGTFRADDSVTREQLSVLLVGFHSLVVSQKTLSNGEVSPECSSATVSSADPSAAVLSNGSSAMSSPAGTSVMNSSADQYTMVSERSSATASLVDPSAASYADAAEISPYAESSVKTAASAGWMCGFPDGSFRPQDTLTRAQLAAVIRNFCMTSESYTGLVCGENDGTEPSQSFISLENAEVYLDADGQIASISGSFASQQVKNCEDAAALLNACKTILNCGSVPRAEAITETVSNIPSGEEHYFCYTPCISGVNVLGSQIILTTDADGTVTGLTSTYDKRIEEVNTYPYIEEEEAVELVAQYLAGRYLSGPELTGLFQSVQYLTKLHTAEACSEKNVADESFQAAATITAKKVSPQAATITAKKVSPQAATIAAIEGPLQAEAKEERLVVEMSSSDRISSMLSFATRLLIRSGNAEEGPMLFYEIRVWPKQDSGLTGNQNLYRTICVCAEAKGTGEIVSDCLSNPSAGSISDMISTQAGSISENLSMPAGSVSENLSTQTGSIYEIMPMQAELVSNDSFAATTCAATEKNNAAADMISCTGLNGVRQSLGVERTGFLNTAFYLHDIPRQIWTFRTVFLSTGAVIPGEQAAYVSSLQVPSQAASLQGNLARVYDYYDTVLGRRSYADASSVSGTDSYGLAIEANDSAVTGCRPAIEANDSAVTGCCTAIAAYGAVAAYGSVAASGASLVSGTSAESEDAAEYAPIVASYAYAPGVFDECANAFWCADYQQFIFGNSGNFEAGLDIVAHEYTHAVIQYSAGGGLGLCYENESGALNESYCDIFGCLIEGKNAEGRWLIGEDCDETLRSLADPSFYGYPDRYSERGEGTFDNGYVHRNSLIFSHAAYRMMTDPRTSAVSGELWAELFYRSLFRLAADADFLQGRRALLATARAMKLDPSVQDAMKDAFDAVEVMEPDVVSVRLQWGRSPQDLDLRAELPQIGFSDGTVTLWFRTKYYYNTGVLTDEKTAMPLAAELTEDATTGYGPETVRIYRRTPGDYVFTVRDYSHADQADSDALAESGAYVLVFLGGGEGAAAIFQVPGDLQGNEWSVCTLHIEEGGGCTVHPAGRTGSGA